MGTTSDVRETTVNPTSEEDTRQIVARYRAYCDACQSDQLDQVPSFWSLPALFIVDTGAPETLHQVVSTPEEMVDLYSTLFGSSTGVDKTVIDTSEVTFYGDKLATIRTSLRHLAGDRLNDKQCALYGCCKVKGEWVFVSHLSLDATE